MTLLCQIFSIECDDAAAVIEAGPRHPAFGSLIDLGTTGLLDAGDGPRQIEEILAHRLVRVGNSDPSLETLSWNEGSAARDVRGLLEHAANEGRLLALLWDADASNHGLLIAAGVGLPNIGFAGRCSTERAISTLRFLMGDVASAEFSLYRQDEAPAGEDEEALLKRLTKLYGD